MIENTTYMDGEIVLCGKKRNNGLRDNLELGDDGVVKVCLGQQLDILLLHKHMRKSNKGMRRDKTEGDKESGREEKRRVKG